MADNQETNSFIEAMGTEKHKVSIPVEEIEKISKYSVNPKAESVADLVAKFFLGFNIFLAFACIIAGIVLIGDFEEEIGIAILLSSIIFVVVGIVIWATLKIIVNISRNLYNINTVLHEIKDK